MVELASYPMENQWKIGYHVWLDLSSYSKQLIQISVSHLPVLLATATHQANATRPETKCSRCISMVTQARTGSPNLRISWKLPVRLASNRHTISPSQNPFSNLHWPHMYTDHTTSTVTTHSFWLESCQQRSRIHRDHNTQQLSFHCTQYSATTWFEPCDERKVKCTDFIQFLGKISSNQCTLGTSARSSISL